MKTNITDISTNIDRLKEHGQFEELRVGVDLDENPRLGLQLIPATDLPPEPIRWLDRGYLARGKLHIIAGAPGTLKTTIALDWCSRITTGSAFPSGHVPEQGRVLIWSGEDDPRDTLVPRLIALGANLERVNFLGPIIDEDSARPFDPAHDVQFLKERTTMADGISMLIVDPIVSAVAGDSFKNAETRRALAPLVDLGKQLDAAIVGITHFSKGTNGRDPVERVTGSLAFGALARVIFGTAREPSHDPSSIDKFRIARCKSNIGPDGGGFSYTAEPVEFDGIETCGIFWGETLEGPARELLTDDETDCGPGSDAAEWLKDFLAHGPCPVKEIFKEAKLAGYSQDQMRRAKAKIGARSEKTGMNSGWVWCLTHPPNSLPQLEGSEGSALSKAPSSQSSEQRLAEREKEAAEYRRRTHGK